MNRFRLAAISACVVLFASCGTKNVSEPQVSDDLTDSLTQAEFAALVGSKLSGNWSYEAIETISGVRTTITANATILPSGTSSDTLETRSSSQGVIDNPMYATQRSWSLSGRNIVFVKTSCSQRGNDGVWASGACLAPLNDTLNADSLLDGSLLALRGRQGSLIYQHR